MARAQRVIENPILNSPFDEPTRHFRFDDDGITDEVVDTRRPSSYFVPIPPPKKKAGQLPLDNFGEPDVTIARTDGGDVTVELHGVDV